MEYDMEIYFQVVSYWYIVIYSDIKSEEISKQLNFGSFNVNTLKFLAKLKNGFQEECIHWTFKLMDFQKIIFNSVDC